MRAVEAERKFEIGTDSAVPSLDGVVDTGPTQEHRLDAIYFDTTDFLLQRHRITLRRREGGTDAGWHLKLPRLDGTRWEITEPLTGSPGKLRIPPSMLQEVRRAVAEPWPTGPAGVLLPVARLTTLRRETALLEADGQTVAVLCDDAVSAAPIPSRWCELEVELTGERDVLGPITEAFEAQGVLVSHSPSKLTRALGSRQLRAEEGRPPGLDDSAAEALLGYVQQQVAVLLGREGDVRRDVPDAVHKTRVATRRLRSVLRTYARLFDRARTDPLRQQLRWFAGVLGAPRDAEVMHAHILGRINALPAGKIVGPVPERVAAELADRHRAAHLALTEALDSQQYAALVDALLWFMADMPWRKRALAPVQEALPPLAATAIARTQECWNAAQEATGAERMHLLHETRKRAKAARYACEAVADVFGKSAVKAAACWEQVTESLGEVQDGAVAAQWLVELRDVAATNDDPLETYDLLLEQERTRSHGTISIGEQTMSDALSSPWP